MKKVLVTGASGFIGKALLRRLIKESWFIRGSVRNHEKIKIEKDIEYISTGDISPETDWKEALEKIDCIIHCAAKVHEINKEKDLISYNLVNAEGTKNLAEQAAKQGVKRFIFLSSIKVNGENTGKNSEKKIFTNKDLPNPQDAYSISKFEAEKALWEIASKNGLEVVIVRLPLVYGYGVKGNLERLKTLIYSGIPLPLKLVNNKRSLIGIDNLIEALICCVKHPNAKNKTFLISDDDDVSTSQLIRHMAMVNGRSVRLFSFPISLLKFFGHVLGKKSDIDRLTESLQLDSKYIQQTINWRPAVSVTEGIRRMYIEK